MSHTQEGRRALGPCGPMRGPCGSRLARARCGPTERRGPATQTPRMGPHAAAWGANANVAHAQGRRHGPRGPMRGPCEARLTRARRRPTGRVIPAARTPRMGPACRCMGGAPASIAALLCARAPHTFTLRPNSKREGQHLAHVTPASFSCIHSLTASGAANEERIHNTHRTKAVNHITPNTHTTRSTQPRTQLQTKGLASPRTIHVEAIGLSSTWLEFRSETGFVWALDFSTCDAAYLYRCVRARGPTDAAAGIACTR